MASPLRSKRILDFHDHVHLRYAWPLENLPSACPCGDTFNVDHAQVCKLSGFIHKRHDELTMFLAKCMKEVIHDVEVEPMLLPLSGETFRHRTANTEPDARADIRARGFWMDRQDAFFDIRVFYPGASSYRSTSLRALYHRFKMEKKKWAYGERIREVQHGSFTPMVFSLTHVTCGGMGKEASVAIATLAAALAVERKEHYSSVMRWLRCCLSFCLARSAIRCIRGSRAIPA